MSVKKRKRLNYLSGQTLVAIGPFAGLSAPAIDSLPNATLNTFVDSSNSRTNPLKYNQLTISSLGPDYATTGAVFVWANAVNLSGQLSAQGQNGVDETAGNGGSGGGGFGSGGFGGAGGSGGNGENGTGIPSGLGGLGFGNIYNSGFTYGNGGNGRSGVGQGAGGGGLGGNGFGGGGGGSDDFANSAGAAGGGLVVLVCNSLFGSGQIFAFGGDADNPEGGAGGGGVIYVIAKKYTGTVTVSVGGGSGGLGVAGAGTARIFELGSNNQTLTLRAFNQSWDNT